MNPKNKKPAERDTIDGTIGFSSQLSGHGKAGHSHTSGFGDGPPDYTLPGYPSHKLTEQPGQEEGGRKRQPTSSIVARVSKE